MADNRDTIDIPATEAASVAALGNSPDRMARWGGVLLLCTALVTAVMVYARVASDADQATLAESLRSIAENRGMYSLFGGARFVSGLTLLAAGWLLLRTWIIRDRWATPWVPYLFITSGAFTAISGLISIVIAVQAAAAASPSDIAGIGTVDNLRWIVGKAGFTAAGLALIVAAWFQWHVGGALRKVAPASAALGVAMQVIWVDAANVIHPVVGSLFFVWLLLIGFMLSTGRVERHFVARYGENAAR